MSEKEKAPGWVWVITESRDKESRLFALTDEESGRSFIPVFKSQEDGAVCRKDFETSPGWETAVEAMQLAVAAQAARENGMDIVFLDGRGRILETLTPALDA